MASGSYSAFLAVIVHSKGVNWGQALATWIPIVIAVAGAAIASIRAMLKWNKARAARTEQLVKGLIQSFAETLHVRFEEIEDHLKRQDQETQKRFDRVDRNTGTDSRLWQILRR